MSAVPGVRSVACPYCAAPADVECVTTGGRRSDPHRDRWAKRKSMLRSGAEFVVRIKDADGHVGVTAGEEYVAIVYWLDPGKVTLLRRVTDGHDPECNQYDHNVEFVKWEVAP